MEFKNISQVSIAHLYNLRNSYLYRNLKKAGLPHMRFHDLRHPHTTLMLIAGIHPKIVSERLGHSKVSITLDIYSHILPGLQEAAVESFDRMLKPKVSDVEFVSKMLAKKVI